MDLTHLTGRAEFTAKIGDREYQFSELTIGSLATLQEWLRKHVPHPLDSLKGHLDGLPAYVAESIAEKARQDAYDWPPQIGSSKGAEALLRTEPGQLEALRVGLSQHHPDLDAAQVKRIYRQLTLDAAREAARCRSAGGPSVGEGTVERIFRVIFGMEDHEDQLPKA